MYSHAFGGPLDTLRNVGTQALDEIGAPKINQNISDTYGGIKNTINAMSKGMSAIQKINFNQFQNVLNTTRNTLKSDLSSSVSQGILQGATQVEEDFMTKYKPYLIGGGVLLAVVVGYMVLKK